MADLLQVALDELSRIHALLDTYEETNDRQILGEVSKLMKILLPKIKGLSQREECKTPKNAPFLIELSNGMKDAVARTKRLGRAKSVVDVNKPDVPSELRGYLLKQGDKWKRVRKRWFEQTADKLYYYIEKGDPNPKGCIDLTRVSEVKSTAKGFDIISPGRTYILQVVSKDVSEDQKYWVNGLRAWKKYLLYLQNMGPIKDSPVPKDPRLIATPAVSTVEEEVVLERTRSESFPVSPSPHEKEEFTDERIQRNRDEEERLRAAEMERHIQEVQRRQAEEKALLEEQERLQSQMLERARASKPLVTSVEVEEEDDIPQKAQERMKLIEAQALAAIQIEGKGKEVVSEEDEAMSENENESEEVEVAIAEEEKEKEEEEVFIEAEHYDEKLQQRYLLAVKEIEERDETIIELEGEINRLKLDLSDRSQALVRYKKDVEARFGVGEGSGLGGAQSSTDARLVSETLRLQDELEKKEADVSLRISLKNKELEQANNEITRLNEQAEQLRKEKEDLTQRFGGLSVEDVEVLQKEYFFALAVGIKLNLAIQGINVNLNAASLWEAAKKMEFRDWNGWILSQFQHDDVYGL